jgi:hypothetical protein
MKPRTRLSSSSSIAPSMRSHSNISSFPQIHAQLRLVRMPLSVFRRSCFVESTQRRARLSSNDSSQNRQGMSGGSISKGKGAREEAQQDGRSERDC